MAESTQIELFVRDWKRYFEELASFLDNCDRQMGTANEDFAEYAVERLGIAIINVSTITEHIRVQMQGNSEHVQVGARYCQYLNELVDLLRQLLRQWQDYQDDYETRGRRFSYNAQLIYTSQPGRPRFNVTAPQLQYLRSMSFTWVQIAEILGVSYMTVYRRRQELGISDTVGRTITDTELHQQVHQIRAQFPTIGQTMIWGRLRSMGFQVPRARVRNAIRHTDPLNTAMRWTHVTARRAYSVPGPNSLWHIDGHHKLIRWRLVTHAAIDGYSRLILFIRCSNNNRAYTVYEHFMRAVDCYGLPSRVRCDQGRENISVARHMLRFRGIERNSVIAGSSVHNQRIERLWRDSHHCVTSLYYRLFYYLENVSLLNPIVDEHLFALHYVFLPRINQSLQYFQASWNNHRIRTERGFTPNQLFTTGMLRLQNSGLAAVDFFSQVPESYGIEEDGISTLDGEVEIPTVALNLSDNELATLQSLVNPLDHSDDYGINLYVDTLQFLALRAQNS